MGRFLCGTRRRGVRWARAVPGLLAAAVASAALPATAPADFTASLSLDQSAGTAAGRSPAIGIDERFASTTGDSVKTVTLAWPQGLLANDSIGGGACLASSVPKPACQVASGTLTFAGGASQPITVDLVKPPRAGDISGLAVVSATGGAADTGDVTLAGGGARVTFSNLVLITETNVTFTGLRLPTSCPSPAAGVTMTAVSQAGTVATATAPLTVTGCSGLPYAPALAVSETRDPTDTGATLRLDVTQAANEAAGKTIVLKLPSGLAVNQAADARCLRGGRRACVVGTVTATTPLMPGRLRGIVTLSGSTPSPTVTVSFPPPFAITLVGNVNLSTGTLTINDVPDLPLADLSLTIGGPGRRKVFTTSCIPSSTTATFTAQSGATKTVTSAVTLTRCPASPIASGSVRGLATGHPELRIRASQRRGAAGIASLAIGLPRGLTFARPGLTTRQTCTPRHGGEQCTTTTLIKGLGVSGAGIKSVALRGGRLVVALTRAAARVRVDVGGPLLTETSSLQSAVAAHKVRSITVTPYFTDAEHTATAVPLQLSAR